MSPEEFENVPWRLGWKHEYYSGKLHMTHSQTAVVHFRLSLAPRPDEPAAAIQPIKPEDRAAVLALYRLAFREAPEFADLDRRQFFDLAARNVDRFFAEAVQPWFDASCLVREERRLLAAAFIVIDEGEPVLQPLFVRPALQRRGWGTRLMNQVVNRLRAAGATHLNSHCHLANSVSEAWHRRFGFEEIPDEWVLAHRARFYLHEQRRRDRLGEWAPGERDDWVRQTEYWDGEWKRLREMNRRAFEATVLQVRGWP